MVEEGKGRLSRSRSWRRGWGSTRDEGKQRQAWCIRQVKPPVEPIPGQAPLPVVAELHGGRLRRCNMVLLQVAGRTEQTLHWRS